MLYPGAVLTVTSDIRLILLSISVALIGSYTALDIAEQISISPQTAQHWWIVGSGITLGISIWAMHFTAILAHQLPIPVQYNFEIVLLAIVISIFGSTIGLFAVSLRPQKGWLALLGGSIFVGITIVVMHYTAMVALQLEAKPVYTSSLIAVSAGIAIGASMGSLSITFPAHPQPPQIRRKLCSAFLMGTAISAMHFVAMAAIRYQYSPFKVAKASKVDANFLAIVIGIAALLFVTVALLASSFGRKLSVEAAIAHSLRQSEERLEQLVHLRTQELEAEKMLSDAANRAKTEFLSNMSHELRTPLTSVIGFSSMLLKQVFGPLNEKQHQYIGQIEVCGYQLLDLINDLLDLSKIEAGREELTLETFLVAELCQECVDLVQEQADRQHLNLVLEIAPTVTTCYADKRRIRQILLNLLSNAIKFTETGSVTLSVVEQSSAVGVGQSLVGDHHHNSDLQFSVIDTGIGIAAAGQTRLFQPFQQLDSSLDRKYAGTGLGLALSRNLARLHGGDITLRSEPGQGSCFTLTLPAESSANTNDIA